MNKQGVVTAVHGTTAVVRLGRHSACASCGACSHGSSEAGKEMLVEALNEAGAAVGDSVQVDLESVQVVRAAFIFYVIPLIALLAGVFATQMLLRTWEVAGNPELWAALGGTVLMVGAFAGIRVNEGRLRKSGRYLSRVVEICSENEPINQGGTCDGVCISEEDRPGNL